MKGHYLQMALFVATISIVGLYATDVLAQVQFSKIDTLGTSFVNWLKNKPVTIFFTVALIISGLLAAFNKMSWFWVLMICVGAFLAFGAPTLVNQLKGVMS